MLNKINNDGILFTITITIVLNLIFFLIPTPIFLIKINFIFFNLLLVFYLINFEKNKFLILFIFILIIMGLGTATTSWDARSIWMFKAKQIFIEDTILYVTNNYALFSHPDYPNIAPAFSAGFVKTIGHWNEIFPKVGFTLLFIPGLILISNFFKKNYYLLSLILIIFTVGKFLINGEVDGLVSIYFVSVALIIVSIRYTNKSLLNFLTLISFCITLTLLKLESLPLIVCLMFSTFFLFYKEKSTSFKILISIFISLIPIISWHIFTNYNGIDNANSKYYAYSLNSLIKNISVFKNHIMIFEYLFLNEKFLISLLLFLSSVFITKNVKIFNFVLLTSFLYIGILFIVYLSTPFEIDWHLSSSATRVIKPIILLLFVFSLYNFTNKSLARSSS
jgi:hypothetical protein